MNVCSSKKTLLLSGVILGVIAALLAYFGNPKNMAICVACFIRDSAGAMKLHQAPIVQYFRPEIVGFAGGSFLIAIATKEYRSTAGSSPMIRFLLGIIMMIGSLVFLGCPLRMVLRMAAGDLNAYVALVGFVLGVATGSLALKKGFSLGRAYETKAASGAVLPVVLGGCLFSVLPPHYLQPVQRGLEVCMLQFWYRFSGRCFSGLWPRRAGHVLPAASGILSS